MKSILTFSGNSMLPHFNNRKIDLIFISDCKEYNVGDVIAFTINNNRNKVIIHRIIKKDEIKKFVVTKGDNNQKADPQVKFSDIIGKVEKYKKTNSNDIYEVFSSPNIAKLSLYECSFNKNLKIENECIHDCIIYSFHTMIKLLILCCKNAKKRRNK